MMKKERIHIEYVLKNVSLRSLWNHLTTPPGLSEWFADEVIIKGKTYTFIWHKQEQSADVLIMKPEEQVRYRWKEEEKEYYFEFRMRVDELTRNIILELTDFADPDEMADSVALWNAQISELQRTLGI